MQLANNTVLITGGTSGIGRALAEQFHLRGNQVIIAGRRQERLDEITAANPGMQGLTLDVTRPDAVHAFASTIRKRFPDLNVLINNAGISESEDLTLGDGNVDTAHRIIHTNILPVLQLTSALLPTLQAQTHATVITTTSGLAFVPMPAFPTYCASKAFLHSWLQSLRAQLINTTVNVLELAPPYVQTALTGERQLTDPMAMPLDAYVAEVMELLSASDPPRGEILVERVLEQRWAERDGKHDQLMQQRIEMAKQFGTQTSEVST